MIDLIVHAAIGEGLVVVGIVGIVAILFYVLYGLMERLVIERRQPENE